MNITEHEYEEYKRLKHEEQWRQEAEGSQTTSIRRRA